MTGAEICRDHLEHVPVIEFGSVVKAALGVAELEVQILAPGVPPEKYPGNPSAQKESETAVAWLKIADKALAEAPKNLTAGVALMMSKVDAKSVCGALYAVEKNIGPSYDQGTTKEIFSSYVGLYANAVVAAEAVLRALGQIAPPAKTSTSTPAAPAAPATKRLPWGWIVAGLVGVGAVALGGLYIHTRARCSRARYA